jgi:predicted GNAT family acetyltransferase
MSKNIALALVFDTLLTKDASETFSKYFPGPERDFFILTDPCSMRTTYTILKALNKSQLNEDYALHIEKVPDSQKKILACMTDLRKSTLSTLQMTARKEMNKEKILHKMFKRNELLEGKIMGLQNKMIDRQETYKTKLMQKQSRIEELTEDIKSAKLISEREVAECL